MKINEIVYENVPITVEVHEGKYGNYYRYKVGKMYVYPMDIKATKVKNYVLNKHIENIKKGE